MPRLFDTYIMVDWSAASTPKTGKDSIWIAELNGETGQARCSNPSTRAEATRLLKRRLTSLTQANRRVLLGFDFSLGYPAGTAKALGLSGRPWAAMSDHISAHISDREDNANNRFEVAASMNANISGGPGPFWGITSKKHASSTLTAKKPGQNLFAEFRIVERYLRECKLGLPKSVW